MDGIFILFLPDRQCISLQRVICWHDRYFFAYPLTVQRNLTLKYRSNGQIFLRVRNMQVNGVGAAYGYVMQQEMFAASNPVYMGATDNSCVQPVAIYARHAQALPDQQPAAEVSTEENSDRASELCKTLIDQIVSHLAIAGHQYGLPLFTGAFARECRCRCRVINPLSGAGEFTAISADQLLGCPLMYIATTQEMGNMTPVMDWLLHKEKLADSTLLCGVAYGSLGELVFSWHIGGQPLFAIGLLILSSPATIDVTVQEYLTGDGRRVPLRTSRLAAAAWLNEQLRNGERGLNDPSSTLIRDLQGLAIAATGCADYPKPQLWQKPVQGEASRVVASPAPPPLLSPPVFPVVPYVVSMPALPQAPVTQMPAACSASVEPVPHSAPCFGDEAECQWPAEEVEEQVTLPDAGLMKNDVVLKKHQDAVPDLGFSLIRTHFSSRVSGSTAQTGSAFTSLAIGTDLVNQLQELVSTEAGDLVHHSFLRCPYLGSSQCFHMKRSAEAFNSRRKKLIRLIARITPQLCRTVIEGKDIPFEKLNEIRAMVVLLTFKFLVYMPKGRHRFDSQMTMLADFIVADCNTLDAFEPGSGAEVLRIVPQAFLAALNSAEIRGWHLELGTEQHIVNALASIVWQSKRHGCYDIMAAVVSLLPRLPLQLALPASGLKGVRSLGAAIQDTFRHFHELLYVRAPSLLHRLSVARTILELSDSLNKAAYDKAQTCRQWLAAIGSCSDTITNAVNYAGKILGADEMAFKRAVRELTQTDQREREAVHQQMTGAAEAEKPAGAKPASWELKLAHAVQLFRQSSMTRAIDIRSAALASAGNDKISQSRIWVECGSALLESHRESIALSITLSNQAYCYQRQLERISQDIPQSFTRGQNHDAVANAWLVDNNYTIPKERSLIVLADHVPAPLTIELLLKALNATVYMYSQAVAVLRKCSVAELHDRANYILRIMELDLSQLIDNGPGLVAPSRMVADVMTIRQQILRQLGFLDDRRQLQAARLADQGDNDHKTRQQLYWRSAYARVSERIYREVDQLGHDESSVAQWVELMDAIGALRCKQQA